MMLRKSFKTAMHFQLRTDRARDYIITKWPKDKHRMPVHQPKQGKECLRKVVEQVEQFISNYG